MKSFFTKDPDRAKYWPFWILVLALSVAMTFLGITSDSPWYDESYSIATSNHSFSHIISLVSRDSHPPLYSLVLRLAVLLFGHSLLVIRGVSAMAVVGTVALAYAFLRHFWGSPNAIVFCIAFLITPMTIGAAQEARMYTLASFFVTGMILSGFAALTDNKKRDWAALVIFASLAGWTHYFALIASGMYWCVLLVKTIKTGKPGGVKANLAKGDLLRRLLIAGAVVIALYLPWMFNLISQATRVSQNYWIGPITLNSVFAILSFPFGQRFGGPHGMSSFNLFIIVQALSITGIVWAIKNKDKNAFLPLSALLTYWLTFTCGILLSWAIRPIFVERYLITCLGALILAFSAFLIQFQIKRFTILGLIVYLFITFPILRSTYSTQVNGPGDTVAELYKDKVKPGDIFVHGSEHTFGILRYYFPDNLHYLYIPKDFTPFGNHAVFAPNAEVGSDLRKYTAQPVTLWLVNRTGEYYSTPWMEIIGAPYREAVNKIERFNKKPGWLTMLIQEVRYNPDKIANGQESTTGQLTLNITGVNPALKGQVVYALYTSDPIMPDNIAHSGAVNATAQTVPLFINNLTHGEYALFCFHDINGNYEPDFIGYQQPIEGLALTIPLSELRSEPKFADLKFTFSENESTQDIQMVYPTKN